MIYKGPADVDIPDVDLWSFVWKDPKMEKRLDNVAFIDGTKEEIQITYRQLRDNAIEIAKGLIHVVGMKKGDVVCLFGPSSLQIPALMAAIYRAGCAVTPSNPLYTPRELAHQCKTAGAKYLITHPMFIKTALEAAKEVGIPVSHVLCMDDPAYPDTQGLKTLSSIAKQGAKHNLPEVKTSPLETALIPFSSGTTGNPKGVELSHQNIVANTCQFMSFMDIRPDEDVYVSFLPLYHMYGVLYYCNLAMKMGVKVVVFPRFELEPYLAAVQKYKSRSLQLIPPVVIALAKHPVVAKYDLSHVETIGSGAAPLSSEVEELIYERFKIKVKQGYGLSEATCGAVLCPGSLDPPPGASGKLIPHLQMRLVDPETGKDAPKGSSGEVWLRGPSVFKGYVNNPKATADCMKEGWLQTGDVAIIDDNGFISIVDRLKELIKVR
jgi:4-coumarate--CoA ligase